MDAMDGNETTYEAADAAGYEGEVVVGVLSDTHGRLPDAAFDALVGSAAIIHAGDIGDPGILACLGAIAPVHAVLGNNDFDEYGASVGRTARPFIAGVPFLIAHYPEDVTITPFSRVAHEKGRVLPHVCVHGHTHIPRIVRGREAGLADFIVCPGSVVYPRGGSRPSIAKIVIEGERVRDVFIEELG